MWLRKSDNTMLQDGVLRAYNFDDIQLLLENERAFMYPEGNLTPDEKMEVRKELLLKVARKAFMESVNSAMSLIAEYAEDLIEITAPCEKVIDGEVKTLQGWHDSNSGSFHNYFKEGDKVAVDVVEYFRNIYPPKTYRHDFLQAGEACDHAQEGCRYITFAYLHKDEAFGEIWQYKGKCLCGGCEKGTDIPSL